VISGPRKKWEEITREERYFTGVLFHDMRSHPGPVLALLVGKLKLPERTTIEDMGFEVCFFRDAAFEGLMKRERHLEKQTFDLSVILSDQRMVIVEAKAQQDFDTEQLDNLVHAKSLIEGGRLWSVETVNLVALFSSRYRPRSETLAYFDATFNWNDIAHLYPENQDIYWRADSIYGDKPRVALV